MKLIKTKTSAFDKARYIAHGINHTKNVTNQEDGNGWRAKTKAVVEECYSVKVSLEGATIIDERCENKEEALALFDKISKQLKK